jgi:dipeptidase D
MVCEKDPDVIHDFLKDPIRLRVRDDMIYATGTTLGADDGIAVAMGLALIASENIPHPPLELLLTTNEETGMDGAHALDPKTISGRTLINIDSEEEGILTVSCAGGCSARINIPVSWEATDSAMTFLSITVEGLKVDIPELKFTRAEPMQTSCLPACWII